MMPSFVRLKAGGHDRDENELSSGPGNANISAIPRLVTLSPVLWDVQTISISTVRDGRKKVSAVADAEPWAGLPVWLGLKARRSGAIPGLAG